MAAHQICARLEDNCVCVNIQFVYLVGLSWPVTDLYAWWLCENCICYLLQGFDQMIEASKSGLPVDLAQVQ